MKNILLILVLLFTSSYLSADDAPALEALQEYFDFVEYSADAISPEQLSTLDKTNIVFIDTRNEAQFTKQHIAGAVHIEWREVLSRRSEIPTNKPVILYCDTGALSSKAHLALKLAGYDNVKLLLGGYNNWLLQKSAE